jgi:Mg-chelatase subunit ChlI
MASKEFMTKLKKHSGKWSKARDAKRTGGMVEVNDGNYTVRLQSMALDVNDNGDPFVQFNMVVVTGPEAGKMIRKRIEIAERSGEYVNNKGKKAKFEITIEDCLSNISMDLQSMGVDTSELDFDDLEALAEELTDSQPAFRVRVKTNKKDFKNVYMDKPVDADDLPSVEDLVEASDADEDEEEEEETEESEEEESEDEEESDEEDSDEEEDEDSEEESEDEDSEEDEEEEEEDEAPQKGAKVKAKPKGTNQLEQYVVLTVNRSSKTCTLKRSRDNRSFKDVSWSLIK